MLRRSIWWTALLACGPGADGDGGPAADDTADTTVAGADTTPGADDTGDGVAGDPAIVPDCTELGFACTAEDADPEATANALALHDEALARIDRRDPIPDIVDWLEAQPGVVLVASSPIGVSIFVEDARPLSVIDSVLARGDQEYDEDWDDAPLLDEALNVVGRGTSREQPPSYPKKALILSPFEFEYKTPDAGPGQWALMTGIPDYRNPGTARFVKDDAVTVGVMGSFSDYDVILYNGHGGHHEATQSSTGRTVDVSFLTVLSGLDSCDDWSSHPAANTPGLWCTTVNNTWYRGDDGEIDARPTAVIAVGVGFFKNAYKGGLKKALVYFNACDSYHSDVYASLVAGQGSVFFGNDATATAGFATRQGHRLVKELAEGWESEEAYDRICNLGSCTDGRPYFAQLERYQAGDDDLRIREAVAPKSIFDIFGFRAAARPDLEGGEVLPYTGSAGDGEPDKLLMVVEARGVASGEEGDFTLTVEVGGQPGGSWTLDDPDVERIDEGTVELLVGVDVGRDLSPPESLALKLELEHPDDEGGESKAEVTVTADNPRLTFRSRIEQDTPGGSLVSEVEAEVPLGLTLDRTTERLEVVPADGPLTVLSYEVELDGQSQTTRSGSSKLQVLAADWDIDVDNPDLGVPTDVVIAPEPLNQWVVAQGLQIPSPHWYPGFVSLHGGATSFPDERDLMRGGFAIRNWQSGTGAVLARKVYDRSTTYEDQTFTESTTLEIRTADW